MSVSVSFKDSSKRKKTRRRKVSPVVFHRPLEAFWKACAGF